MDALVLAGGPSDALAAHTPGAPNKAFVEIAGVPLVTRTLRALRDARSIERIVVVAPETPQARAALDLADEVRPDGRRIRDSLQNGIAGFPADRQILISTSDLPVLTGEAVDDFVQRLLRADADVAYGCLERRTHFARFPNVPHTWAPFKDGTFCGGGLMGMKPRAFASLSHFIERLGQARKNPLRLASLFGWDVLFRFAFRQLTIAQAEERASSILGEPVRAIVSPYAETAVNVDRVSDIALAETLLATAANASA
jgi:GTP:adenosylcobinamide-phosphate guanylyltransferase